MSAGYGAAMPKFRDPLAIVVGAFITIAGVMHFVNPGFFDAIVDRKSTRLNSSH